MSEQRYVRCAKCAHVGPEAEFPKGVDFFQMAYIAACPKCDNRQAPGDASMRGFGGERPFTFVRPGAASGHPVDVVAHHISEAS